MDIKQILRGWVWTKLFWMNNLSAMKLGSKFKFSRVEEKRWHGLAESLRYSSYYGVYKNWIYEKKAYIKNQLVLKWYTGHVPQWLWKTEALKYKWYIAKR